MDTMACEKRSSGRPRKRPELAEFIKLCENHSTNEVAKLLHTTSGTIRSWRRMVREGRYE